MTEIMPVPKISHIAVLRPPQVFLQRFFRRPEASRKAGRAFGQIVRFNKDFGENSLATWRMYAIIEISNRK